MNGGKKKGEKENEQHDRSTLQKVTKGHLDIRKSSGQ